MTAPDLGPCRCGPQHEHSDFEPYPCADCGCPEFQPLETADSLTVGAETPPEPPHRPSLVIPADALDFTRQRVAQTAQWVDGIVDGIRRIDSRDPDDPLAVCGLADMLEANPPEDVDYLDALALVLRREAARPSPAQRALAALRRVRQR